ncbi:SDR family oxidoreductase [Candidatus Amarolinea dominans]|uniref:SDR family oxidoreductase n=1 Tax=Candidatus Amarolinea dominans TaxID=3140696 RepID=UPI001D4B914E|nr:SDR family oxidoreductase [Anaerolineae bacterium]
MFTGLKGKNVLITGGTSGIGQAIAVRFAAEGAHVAINYRSQPEDAAETDEQIHRALEQCVHEVTAHGVNHILVRADVSKEDEVVAMMQEVVDKLGGLDILVNNAGIQIAADSDVLSVANFDRVLGVNLRGAFLAAQAAIRHFLAAGKPGVILNVSSVHQIIPKPRFLSYSVSKGDAEPDPHRRPWNTPGSIRVNAIGPGATITPINRAWVDDPRRPPKCCNTFPSPAGTSEEMAAVTAFLASDEAAYITGQTLYVDGGLTLYPDFRTAWSSE